MVDCSNDKDKHYQILLDFLPTLRELDSEIFIIKVIDVNAGNRVKWACGEEQNDWPGREMKIKNKTEITFDVTGENRDTSNYNYTFVTCKNHNIEPNLSQGRGNEIVVLPETIEHQRGKEFKFKLDKDSKKESFGRVEYNIVIDATKGSNLKWTDSITPKAIFRAF